MRTLVRSVFIIVGAALVASTSTIAASAATPDHLIWIEGNKPVKEERPATNRAFTKTGLRTVFYLLINKDAINLPYRVLAQETGVALGNINNIIGGLKDAGKTVLKKEPTDILNRLAKPGSDGGLRIPRLR